MRGKLFRLNKCCEFCNSDLVFQSGSDIFGKSQGNTRVWHGVCINYYYVNCIAKECNNMYSFEQVSIDSGARPRLLASFLCAYFFFAVF